MFVTICDHQNLGQRIANALFQALSDKNLNYSKNIIVEDVPSTLIRVRFCIFNSNYQQCFLHTCTRFQTFWIKNIFSENKLTCFNTFEYRKQPIKRSILCHQQP